MKNELTEKELLQIIERFGLLEPEPEKPEPKITDFSDEQKETICFFGPAFEKALENIGSGKYESDFGTLIDCYSLKRSAPMSMILCGFLSGLDLGAQIAEFLIQKGGSCHE